MCHLGHAEHYAKNRTSLRGLDRDTLFFWMTRYNFRQRLKFNNRSGVATSIVISYKQYP